MLPVAAALLAWGVSGAVARTAPAEATSPPATRPAPAATAPSAGGGPPPPPGTEVELDLPLPRALPCRRFETVEVEVGKDADSLSGNEGTTLAWTAGGRAWSFSARTWQQPPEPLTPAALPARVGLTTPAPFGAARITLFCRRYDATNTEGQSLHTADPFNGIRWLCKGRSCVPEVGYRLSKDLAVSPGRLRLCAKDPQKNWNQDHPRLRPCRDITPGFEDRGKALALAGEILADARRTLTDACRAPDACTATSRTVMAVLRPTRWRPTTYSAIPAGLRLTAEVADRKLALDCRSGSDGAAHCEVTLRDPTGRPLLTYAPIDAFGASPIAILDLPGQGHITLTAAPNDRHDKPDGASTLSGEIVGVR